MTHSTHTNFSDTLKMNSSPIVTHPVVTHPDGKDIFFITRIRTLIDRCLTYPQNEGTETNNEFIERAPGEADAQYAEYRETMDPTGIDLTRGYNSRFSEIPHPIQNLFTTYTRHQEMPVILLERINLGFTFGDMLYLLTQDYTKERLAFVNQVIHIVSYPKQYRSYHIETFIEKHSQEIAEIRSMGDLAKKPIAK